MEYAAVRTPETDREVYLPAARAEAWRESADLLLEPALALHDRALAALRDRRVPEALSLVQRALRLASFDPGLARAAALMALQHDDHVLARRAIHRMEQFGLEDAAPFRGELARRIRRWNAHVERPGALRDKYAAADPDASYREMLLLRDRLGGQLRDRERDHLRRWRISVPASHQRDVTQPVLATVAVAGLGAALWALWQR